MKNPIFLILVGVILIGLLYFLAVKCSPKVNEITNEDLKEKIEHLEGKIDSLSFQRDSLKSIVDTSKVKIIEIHEEYNKIRTNIIYQSVDSDYIQFAKYCSDNRGLLDISDSSAVKDY